MLTLLNVPFLTFFTPARGGMLRRIKAHLAEVEAAHDAVRRLSELPDEAARDTGVCDEEALGLPSRQAALPFFMQPGFSRHSDR